MKKLLACLLALSLPCCALADTITLDWSMDVSPDGLAMLMDAGKEALGVDETVPQADKLLEGLAEVLSGFSAHTIMDTSGDRYRLSIMYQDLVLFSADGQDEENAAFVTSNLLPGFLLTAAIDPATTQIAQNTLEALKQLSWEDFRRRAAPYQAEWINSLEMTEEYGSFAGDAYAGTGRCRTYRFDERDLAVMLEYMTASRNDAIEDLLRFCGHVIWDDPESTVAYLRSCIRGVSIRNQYRYVLRIVDDGASNPTPIGYSMLVYDGYQLVATLSAGFPDDGFKAVLGYGLQDENYYLSFTMNGDPAVADELTVQLWQDQDKAGFYTASRSENANLLLTAVLSAAADSAMNSASDHASSEEDWALRALMWGKAFGNHQLEIATAFLPSAMNEELSVSVALDSAPLFSSRLTAAYTDDLPPLEKDGLRSMNIEDLSFEDMQLMVDIATDVGMELAIELFKRLPAELLSLLLSVELASLFF